MKIGVVIGTHLPTEKHVSVFLNRCLPSLAAQTRKPDETVIVINGYYKEKLDTLIDDIKKIYNYNLKIIIDYKKRGCGPARNIGVRNLGPDIDYFCLLDVDDEYIDKKIELQEKHILERSYNIDVLGTLFYINENGEYKFSNLKNKTADTFEKIKDALDRDKNPMCGASCLIKKKPFLELGGFEERYIPGHVWPQYNRPMWEDFDMWIRFRNHGCTLENLTEYLYVVHLGLHVKREF
tara:strand:- start:474 stop:1184 length:711 start_codon:yes stop_codon:yes gene_type:complete